VLIIEIYPETNLPKKLDISGFLIEFQKPKSDMSRPLLILSLTRLIRVWIHVPVTFTGHVWLLDQTCLA
jgi:hypothetical protein